MTTAFLPGLVNSLKRTSHLKISVIALIIAMAIIGFALFSSEQFFCQLDTSRAAVSVGEILTELEAINAELKNLEASEHTYQLTHDLVVAENFMRSYQLLQQHLASVRAFPLKDQQLGQMLSEMSTKIETHIDFSKQLMAQQERSALFPAEAKPGTEETLRRSASDALVKIITQLRNLKKSYANTIQNASFTTLFLILTFRSTLVVLLIICLLLVSRYFVERKAMEASLQGAETKFRAVFDQTFQFSGVLSPQGNLLDFNRTLLSLPNIDTSLLLGRPFWQAAWWEHSSQIQSDLKTAVVQAATGNFTRFEGNLLSNGSSTSLDFSVKPVKDERGRISMLILEARDITKHKLAEQASAEKAARLKAIVETAPDGIITLTTTGQIESANAAMHAIFGYTPEELVEQNIDLMIPDFFGGHGQTLPCAALPPGARMILNTGCERVGLHKSGKKFPIELSLSLLSLGNHQILTGIVRDITAHQEAQQRLKDFYSSVSHELRTPLTSIRTALALIEDTMPSNIAAQTAPVIHIAQSEADRLIRLINDLLDIRKIEEGKFTLKIAAVEPKQLIEKAMDAVGNIANSAGIELVSHVNASAPLHCDEDRIIQVLTNLLSNAIKFSPPDDQVILSVNQNQQRCIFEVVDHGLGIAESQIDKLFRRFEQLDSTNGQQKKGSGLGLFISKKIVENHGGAIGVDKSSKNGCRFWFDLPIEAEDYHPASR